jgi:hypothetical protein
MEIKNSPDRPVNEDYRRLMAGGVVGDLKAPNWLLEDVAVLVGRNCDGYISPEACREAVALLALVFRAHSSALCRA